MTFVHPGLALATVALVALPIVIHVLMRRRRRPMAWAAMRFLLEAYRRQRRRLRLEQVLLLAARCLAVLLVGLAVAGPTLDRAGVLGGGGGRRVYLVVDNGLTSWARDGEGVEALRRHKERADGLLALLGPGDRAGVVAMAGTGGRSAVVSGGLGAVRLAASAVEGTDGRADLAGALDRIAEDLRGGEDAGAAVVVLLSEWREGSVRADRPLADLSKAAGGRVRVLAWAPEEGARPNVAVVEARPLRPVMVASGGGDGAGRTEQVRVRLVRFGPLEEATTRVLVSVVEGATRRLAGEGTVVWSRGQSEQTAAVPVSMGTSQRRAALLVEAQTEGDALARDDSFRVAVEVRATLRVGIVAARRVSAAGGLDPSRTEDWLRLALRPQERGRGEYVSGVSGGVEVVQIDPGSLDTARLAGLDAVFVAAPHLVDGDGWGRLGAAAERGALLVVFPPTGGADGWSEAMSAGLGTDVAVAPGVRERPEGIGLAPGVGEGRRLLDLLRAELEALVRPVRVWRRVALGGGEVELAMEDGWPLLVSAAPEGSRRGLVVVWAVPMSVEWTNLPTQPLFVALVHEVLSQGVGRARGVGGAVAGTVPALPAGIEELHPFDDGPAIRVDGSGAPATVPMRAGVWEARDALGTGRALVCVNADTSASSTEPADAGRVAAWLAGAGDPEFTWVRAEGEEIGRIEGHAVSSLAEALERPREGSALSVVLLAAGLIVLVAELAMARWFSHAWAGAGVKR